MVKAVQILYEDPAVMSLSSPQGAVTAGRSTAMDMVSYLKMYWQPGIG